MTLTVEAREGALIFRSKDYFVELFGSRWRLPAWLAPGGTAFESVEDGRFRFDVEIGAPLVGRIVRYRGWLQRAANAT